jgi:hypothetical protein
MRIGPLHDIFKLTWLGQVIRARGDGTHGSAAWRAATPAPPCAVGSQFEVNDLGEWVVEVME